MLYYICIQLCICAKTFVGWIPSGRMTGSKRVNLLNWVYTIKLCFHTFYSTLNILFLFSVLFDNLMEALNSLYIKTNVFIPQFGGFLNYFKGITDALEFIYGPKVKKF